MNKKEMEQDTDIRTDELKYLFIKARTTLLTEADALKNDLTDIYYDWKRDKIDSREIIIIGIRGEVRTGKSTVEIAEVYDINEYISEIGLNPEAKKKVWRWIFGDQVEFLRFINGDERNICLGIDEFSTLARTGVNSTTEEALMNHYSDIFAGQYLHRVCAGTDGLTDKNTTVILDVIGKDEEKRITRCKLIYRDIITKQQITLGYVDIKTGHIVKNWIDGGIRDIVEKREAQTMEEIRKIEEYKKKDFYVRYQVRKYRRMELLKKEGIRDIRELEFAEIILNATKELEEFSKTQKPDKELVNVIVDEKIRETKRIYSIITKLEISQKVSALLNINYKINQLDNKKKKQKSEVLQALLQKTMEKMQDLLEKRMKEQKHLKKLYEEYMEIE